MMSPLPAVMISSPLARQACRACAHEPSRSERYHTSGCRTSTIGPAMMSSWMPTSRPEPRTSFTCGLLASASRSALFNCSPRAVTAVDLHVKC